MADNPDHLIINEVPQGNFRTLVIAYSGWPDAAEGATTTLKYLIRHLQAKRFAHIEPEEFYIFSQERPRTSRSANGTRAIHWPSNEFYYWNNPNDPSDGIILLKGVEPNLRWKTFSSLIADLAEEHKISNVVHLGALLDSVPHTRRTRMTGSSTNGRLQDTLDTSDIRTSTYQGPTGISTAVMEAITKRGMGYASLWAHTSHYLHAAPNYRTSLALAENLVRLLNLPLDLKELRTAADTFDREIDKAIDKDNQLKEYVQKLEMKYDESSPSLELTDPSEIVDELEQFLKANRKDDIS